MNKILNTNKSLRNAGRQEKQSTSEPRCETRGRDSKQRENKKEKIDFKFCEIQRVLWFCLFILMALDVFADPVPIPARPNFLIILVDDMGYADTEPYGSEIKTPHLMSLAQNGLRFTQFFNCAKCAPTRSSLMTGLYPQQAGMAANPHESENVDASGEEGAELGPHVVTIAEVLKSAGYATYMSGKWHLTGQPNATTEAGRLGWPRQRGFDRFFGFLPGMHGYWQYDGLIRENTFLTASSFPTGSYLTDLFADQACAYLADHAKTQTATPFFLYLAFNAPHRGITAKAEDTKAYRGVYDVGWDVIRAQRLAKQKELGVIPPNCVLSPRSEESPSWASYPEAKRADAAEIMATYAGMITCLDRGIGKVLATLDEAKLRENTVVIFLSDNGANVSKMPELKAKRNGLADGVIGAPWSNVANTPFRYGKSSTWQGGIATECIITWPAGLPASQRGAITHQVGHVVDLMPTCVELAKATYPKEFKGNDIQPQEGMSLVPVMKGDPLGSRKLCWRYGRDDAALNGMWKILRQGEEPWRLFDLSQDPNEMKDQAATHPEQLKSLEQQWQDWATRVHAEVEKKSKTKQKKK